jgi:hypothetical protein
MENSYGDGLHLGEHVEDLAVAPGAGHVDEHSGHDLRVAQEA